MIAAWSVLFLLIPCLNCFGTNLEKEKMSATKVSILSEEEKDWYHKFQNGSFVFDGWKQISHDIVSNFPDKERKKIKRSLHVLGEKIGVEWSKDNAIRKIDTDMLRKWGDTLDKAVEHGINHVHKTIRHVEREVDNILHDRLVPGQE